MTFLFPFQLNAKATGLENKSICSIASRTSATVRCTLQEKGRRNAPETVTFGCGLRTAPGTLHARLWGSCDRDDNPKTVIERMTREAVLLKPGEHMDGTLQLDTRLFGGLRPGKYRIEGVLYCWRDEEFSAADVAELAKMGG
jgi:hypothetical protein